MTGATHCGERPRPNRWEGGECTAEPGLERKIARLRSRDPLEVVRSGLLEDVDHTTFVSGAKRRYHCEAGSALGSPVAFSSGEAFFVGAHSYMNAGGYSRGDVLIGRFCSIGRRVTIAAGMHPMHGLTTSPRLPGRDARADGAIQEERFTVIESDVWIGDGAVILPGRTLGLGSVVAANAVVTQDVEPHEIVAGVPARPIGRRFDRDVSDRIRASLWWERSLADLSTLDTTCIDAVLDGVGLIEPHAYETYLYDNTR